jgi:putative nucleotidyltransferase with HDIG domain
METVVVDNKIKQVVSNIRNLPTPPMVFHQIQKVISDPNVSAAQIASILAEDPAISVKVLKLTNSAFYGLAREVDSVKHAVVIVGMEAIKNLVLSASVLDMFKSDTVDQEFQESYWRHSLATGFCCRFLAKKLQAHGMMNTDSAFSSGLLHDIGKIVIACFLSDEYARLQEARAEDTESQDIELEDRVLGFNHAQIGAFLAVQWKLPNRLAESIDYHHQPRLGTEDDPISYVVNIGDFVAKRTFYDNDKAHLIGTLDPEVMAYMQITEADLDEYSDILREEYVKAETFMQMAGLGK